MFSSFNSHAFLKFNSLLLKNNFIISRQKVLLKRRKASSKKQKVARKKFIQENPGRIYAQQMKILQIQKQLDKKFSRNHHLNELMDQLFYPDVRYANQKNLQQNLLSLTASPKQKYQLDKKASKEGNQNEGQAQFQQFDQLIQQIYLCQIPPQLFQIYLKNSSHFSQNHLITFFNRLRSYFKNKQKIQERVTQKWRQSLQKLKLTDIQKKKRKRCPYIFLDQEQLIRDSNWNKVIKDINKNINLTIEKLPSKKNSEKNQAEETQQIQINEDYFSLQNNSDLVLSISAAANYIPEELFDSITSKALLLANLNKNKQKSDQKLPMFSHEQKVKIFRVLSLKSKTKATLTKSVHIQQPDHSKSHQQSIIVLGKKLAQDILKSQRCSAEDLGAIIRSGKGYYKFINSVILQLCKSKILKYLSQSNLQRSIDYLYAYWLNGTIKDIQFIEIVIYDIYRKLPYSFSKHHLFFLLSFIRENKIIFRQSQISINISQIYPRITQTISKYLNRGQLSHQQIKIFVDSIFQNYPIYKRTQDKVNVLQMISTAIVKIGNGFKLQQIGQLLFKITIMGHRSKIFSKYVFQRYLKQYKKLMKQYQNQRTHLLIDKNSNDILKQSQQSELNLPSISQVLLQENLVMMLWAYIVNNKSHDSQLSLNDMMQIYPLRLQTQDQMIIDLIEDLDSQLQQYNLFPRLSSKDSQNKSQRKMKGDNIKPVKNSPMLKTNTFSKYVYTFKEASILQILQKLEVIKQTISQTEFQNLIDMCIGFCLSSQKEAKYLGKFPNRWNDSVRDLFTHRNTAYQSMRKIFIQNYASKQKVNPNSKKNLHQEIIRLLRNHQNINSQTSKTLDNGQLFKMQQKRSKNYELL